MPTKKKFSIPGYPFVLRSKAQRDRALAVMAEVPEQKKSHLTPPATHGCGDPNAEFPGDRPEAFDSGLSQAHFDRHFTSTTADIAAITFSDGTQIHGKLMPGHKPAAGYTLDAAGVVVKVL